MMSLPSSVVDCPTTADFSQMRQFLPYAAIFRREPEPLTLRSWHRHRELRWSVVVVDRHYDLLFASWMERKPTMAQLRLIAFYGLEHWDQEAGGMLHLYDDSCVPTSSLEKWNEYQARLHGLAKLRCLPGKGRGGKSWSDYECPVAAWRKAEWG